MRHFSQTGARIKSSLKGRRNWLDIKLPNLLIFIDLSSIDLNLLPTDRLISSIARLPNDGRTSLNLRSNNLHKKTVDDLVAILKAIPPHIKMLDLRGNGLLKYPSDGDFRRIIKAIPKTVTSIAYEGLDFMSLAELNVRIDRGEGFYDIFDFSAKKAPPPTAYPKEGFFARTPLDPKVACYISEGYISHEELTTFCKTSPWLIKTLSYDNIHEGIKGGYISIKQLNDLTEDQCFMLEGTVRKEALRDTVTRVLVKVGKP